MLGDAIGALRQPRAATLQPLDNGLTDARHTGDIVPAPKRPPVDQRLDPCRTNCRDSRQHILRSGIQIDPARPVALSSRLGMIIACRRDHGLVLPLRSQDARRTMGQGKSSSGDELSRADREPGRSHIVSAIEIRSRRRELGWPLGGLAGQRLVDAQCAAGKGEGHAGKVGDPNPVLLLPDEGDGALSIGC